MIGYLAIRSLQTAGMDHSLDNFGIAILFSIHCTKINRSFILKNLSIFKFGGQITLNVPNDDMGKVNKCFSFSRAFTENGLRRRYNLLPEKYFSNMDLRLGQ